MARASSNSSNAGTAELRVTKGNLDQRWRDLTRALGVALAMDARALCLDAEYQAEGVWAGLTGNACERARRNRGSDANVVPIAQLPSDLVAWLGVREVWEHKGGARPYQFRELGLTVHFGFRNDPEKPQILRLEWPGVRDWSGSGLSFAANGAGHPHWQVDIFQTLATTDIPNVWPATLDETVEEFGEVGVAVDLNTLIRSLTVEKLHLASAAPWWQPRSGDALLHTNAPRDIGDLTRWMTHAIDYIRQELQRCVIRPNR